MSFFDNHRLCCYALGVVIAVGAAVTLGNYYRLQVEDVYQASLDLQTREYAADLQRWKSDGFAIGALSILGRHTPSLKRVIQDPAPSAELMERAVIPLKTLSMVVGANHAFLLNREGVIVAAYDQQGQAPLGANLAFRPYFKVALKGGSSVYGAISSSTGTRMFYMAVPVYESRSRQDKVIGVLVARFDASLLDASLGKQYGEDRKLILSPGGVVLAASVPEFLLKADRAWAQDEFTGEVRRQFGDYPFVGGVPERLPFDTQRPVVRLDGRRYSLSRVDFDWNDPSGPWTLITLGDLDTVLPAEQVLLIKGVSAVVFLLLLWGGLRRLADARQHKRDVTQIEQSERRLDMALQSGALGLWDWNVSLGIVINNDVWLRILGYSKQELDQTFGNGLDRWACLVHPQDREPVLARLKAHLDNQTDEYRAEYRMRSKSGRWLWVLDIGKVMQRDAAGAPARVTGVLQDITHAVEVQRAIVDSQTKLQSMIANIPGVVFRSLPDAARTMVFVSDAIDGLSGFSAAHFLSGHSYRELVHPDDLEIFERGLGCASYMLEYRIVTASQEVRWVYDKGQTIVVDGVPQYLDGVIFDISERKAVEAQVQQSRRDAELATQAKSEFLDSMSHEIRTPLNAIIGMAHLVLDMPMAQAQRDSIEKIDRAAKNLVGTINGVLDLSKIEAGKLSMEQVCFNLRELVDDVLLLVRQRAEEKGLQLRLDIPALLPRRYVGDPLRLAQVLTNLVDNSIKFTEAGHVCIGVCLVRQWNDKVLLCFSVTDTGVGISAEQQARLFNAFVQADLSISRRYGGSGLGLTIAKKIVQMMQGDIWVQSRPGQGAMFKFTVQLSLPQPQLAAAVLEGDAPATAVFAGSSGGAAGLCTVNDYARLLAGTRVLVVEDNRLNQDVLQGLLLRAGVRVALAANGAEALRRLLEDGRFDGVLMDCQMPVLDGYGTTRQIRRHPHLQALPIIAVTASSEDEVQGRALAAGMSDLVSKPLDVSAFYRTLVRWIKPLAVAPDDIRPCSAASPSMPAYPGIDAALGLAMVNQDQGLYQKLLADFRDDQQRLTERLWLAHGAGDLHTIGFLAHSLQGTAGHIGATALRQAARHLEQQCGGQADLGPAIRQLERCLQPLLAGLKALPAAQVELPAGEHPLSDAELGPQLERLAVLLHEQNAQALTLIDELCRQAPGSELQGIRERIYRLEFQQAHDLLMAWRG
ncbi:PAS domain-containing protein [Pseudomonas chlororaphis]|uniref:histidine kinase n=1 Tax=Pseudomonas chlororaphis TaxID=587753 RepID=A0A1Q8ENB6_9PSED|nr:PAS domain-containing protein [Pseudomonas chlororaphis]OLF53294.1 hybrid sensor histidine kinase/response regulator [Pseudomonas chlororaphis]